MSQEAGWIHDSAGGRLVKAPGGPDLELQSPVKILGIVVYACNSRAGDVETGGSEGMQASQPSQNSECQFSERPVSTEGVHEERHCKLTSGLAHICVC